MRILVTGGVRSGKSRHAEALLSGFSDVTYVACGPSPTEDPDPDWVARIAAHQSRRPASWTTLETGDLVQALEPEGPVLIDCLGTWLTGLLDKQHLWEADGDVVTRVVEEHLAKAIDRLTDRDDVVVVTNEVGSGIVPAHRSGRLFRDLLGWVNQEVAAACDELHVVIAGRVLVL